MYRVPEDQLGAFEAQFRPVAVTQVQRDLALDAVVEAHNLRATEAEIDERVAAMAAARNVPAGEMYATLAEGEPAAGARAGHHRGEGVCDSSSSSPPLTRRAPDRWPPCIRRTSSSARAAGSGPTTSSPGCSWTGSSSWARRSTMTSRTSSSRSSSSSRPTTPRRTSISTSIRRAAWSRRAWPSTTRCSTCARR